MPTPRLTSAPLAARTRRRATRPARALPRAARLLALGLVLAAPCSAAAAPQVSAISATWGPTAGGTVLTITGTGLTGATGVSFGTDAAQFSVVSDTEVTATAPAHAAAAVDVTVSDASTVSAATCADVFAYVPDTAAPLPAHGCAVAFPLHTSRVGGGPQQVTLSVPDAGAATLLDATSAPAAVVTTAAGSYVLDGAGVTYTPAPGYVGPGAVKYQLQGDAGSSATSTYSTLVTKPAAPVAPVVTSLGDPGFPQQRALAVKAGEHLQMLDAAGQPADAVIVSGEGRYDLAFVTATIEFRPDQAFRGTAHGIRYRLTDDYHQSAIGQYIPTVTGGTGGGGGGGGSAPAVRLTSAVLNVASATGRLPIGCGLTTGLIADCQVTLFANIGGHPVAIGSGLASPPSAVSDVVVAVTLTARGIALSRQPGGVAVRADGSVAVTGVPGRVTGSVNLRTVARTFMAAHAVRFAAGSARLSAGERSALSALARKLTGVRRIDCIGAARDVRRGARRTSLARARAKAVCSYLRTRVAHGTVLVPRAARSGEHHGTSRHADILLTY